MRLFVLCGVGVVVVVIGSACGAEPARFELPFAARVGANAFACGQTYDNVGVGAARIQPADFRVYVHNVEVLDEEGTAHAVALDDNEFQHDGVALLDFEDGTGACDTGSPQVHTAITGELPSDISVSAARFTVGVPAELNHLDVLVAAPPFNIPSLWWSWAGGYKYIKADVLVGDNELEAFFHHGSTTCTETDDGFSCAFGHLGDIEVPLDVTTQAIGVDLAAMYASVDLAADLVDGDNVRGCMSFSNDPDCQGMMGSIGVPFADAVDVPTQTAFSAVPR